MLELFPGNGCGNRFLLVREGAMLAAGEHAPRLAQRLCGTHYDGLLLLGEDVGAAGRDGERALAVTIFNRDGSDGGACLNGLRVAACFTGLERGRLLMSGHRVDWRKVAGGFELDIPLLAADLAITEHKTVEGDAWFQVEFWNPHAVFTAMPEGQSLANFAASVAAQKKLFPRGVNVEVVPELGRSEELAMRVFERGVGETEACGSGALAVAAVAWQLGAGPRVGVKMTGGRLEVQQTESGHIRLRGAAQVEAPLSLRELLRAAPKTRV
jgi:diaminopimelate epimerase